MKDKDIEVEAKFTSSEIMKIDEEKLKMKERYEKFKKRFGNDSPWIKGYKEGYDRADKEHEYNILIYAKRFECIVKAVHEYMEGFKIENPSLKKSINNAPENILNAYLIGDLTLEEAIELLNEWRTKKNIIHTFIVRENQEIPPVKSEFICKDIREEKTETFSCPLCGEFNKLVIEDNHIYCPECRKGFNKVEKWKR